MADARIYQLGDSVALGDIAHGLEDYFVRHKNMEAEGIFQGENAYFIQARQQKEWMKFVGMDKAVQVRLTVHGDSLTVEVGAGRWVDKLGAATVGYLIFAPLLITAAIGALGQEQLPRDIFDFVERYIILHGGPIPGMTNDPFQPCSQPVDTPAPASAVCPGCQAPLPEGARFCAQCGQPVPAANTCPQCRAQLPDGARFCSFCGAPLQ